MVKGKVKGILAFSLLVIVIIIAINVFDAKPQRNEQQADQADISDEADTSKDSRRVPSVMQPDTDVMTYDPEDTIYYKTYYDDFSEGKIMYIDYAPHMEMKEELEEAELEELFWVHGYSISFHNTEFREYHLRVVEITKKMGHHYILSAY